MGSNFSTIKEGLPRLATSVSSLRDFAKGSVKGAVVLGPDRVISLLSEYLQGQPVEFRARALLNELVIKEGLTPIAGIQIEPLPFEMNSAGNELSEQTNIPVGDLLGRTLISLDCTVAPALFCPRTERGHGEDHVHPSFVSGFTVESLCNALALETNTWTEAGTIWHDYGDLSALFTQNTKARWSYNHAQLRDLTSWSSRGQNFVTSTLYVEGLPVVDADWTRLRDILGAVNNMKSSRLQTAISRWIESKSPNRNVGDQFIDLRIALEALYLAEGSNTENGFRMALNGAWHLGADFPERQRIFQQLRGMYSAASKMVHAGNASFAFDHRQLHSDCRDLCRRGILKILAAGQPNNWTDLVLGGNA